MSCCSPVAASFTAELASPDFSGALSHALEMLDSSDIDLREEQKQAIHAVYEGRDVFVWLPTGFGKSICFQTLPFVLDYKLGLVQSDKKSIVLVVAPLVALMVDQVQSLQAKGVKAVILTSGGREGTLPPALLATQGTLDSASLVFCSPEALVQDKWRDALDKADLSARVCAVVVDEAHCVSKWSKDFRPAYSRLAELRALVPSRTPFMACTATATRSDKMEVLESLEMSGCVEVSVSPDRPNIYYEARPRTNLEADLESLLSSLSTQAIDAPRVIVYCPSLDVCADLYAHFHYELGEFSYHPPGSAHLSEHRLFGMYHAATPQHNKDVILQSLLRPDGVVRVVFATVALGMGVNLKDVNSIIHYGAPRSIEDFFQESGRGGRSGGMATSTIYWKPADCPVSKNPVTLRDRELIQVRRFLENTTVCRQKWLLDHFDMKVKKVQLRCCDVCSAMKERGCGSQPAK